MDKYEKNACLVEEAVEQKCAFLQPDPFLAQRVLNAANEKGEMKVKKKISVGFVIALVLVMMTAVTALAVGLTNYFSGFAALENEYGEYEQWPGSAKVQLVELMLESGTLTAEDTPQWTDDLTGKEKEAAAEDILGDYFDGMVYVDTYNAMTRVLGPIERWTDEQRVMYTELLEKYGKLTDSWPVFQLPGNDDLTRDQAVARAKEALLSVFSLDAEYLSNLTPVDALFRADKYNEFGLPEDEPYWTVDIGYGYTGHWVHMKRNGDILALSVPGSSYVYWGEDILDRATLVEPGEYDVTREEAIANARNSLSEIMNLPFEEVDAMTATAQFLYHERFCRGDEPVWLVNWSRDGALQYRVLLGYDGRHIDVEPAGKQFDNVETHEPHLDEIVAGMLGIESYDVSGIVEATLEEKASFYERFKAVAEEYAASHPYFVISGSALYSTTWQMTRNVMGVPGDGVIDASRALSIALDDYEQRYGTRPDASYVNVYYIVTNPDRPEWRFVGGIDAAVNALTGEILENAAWGTYPGRTSFIGVILE